MQKKNYNNGISAICLGEGLLLRPNGPSYREKDLERCELLERFFSSYCFFTYRIELYITVVAYKLFLQLGLD